MNTGERIKEARLAAGLTQTELADKIGVKFSAVHKYESGRVVNLKRETLSAIAHALNVSESWLLCLEQEESKSPARDIDIIYDALNESGQKELCRYGRYLTGLADYQAEDAQPHIWSRRRRATLLPSRERSTRRLRCPRTRLRTRTSASISRATVWNPISETASVSM